MLGFLDGDVGDELGDAPGDMLGLFDKVEGNELGDVVG